LTNVENGPTLSHRPVSFLAAFHRVMRRRLVLLSGSLQLAATAPAGDAMPEGERARVDRLILYVESRTDVAFVRNGTAYTSRDAATFLRGKMDRMGRGVTTAQQFVEQIASKSSTSGEPYMIRHADGRVEHSAKFLGEELKRMEATKPRTY
jgi:hypothetical protein